MTSIKQHRLLLMVSGRGTRAIPMAEDRFETPHVYMYFNTMQQPLHSEVPLIFLEYVFSCSE